MNIMDARHFDTSSVARGPATEPMPCVPANLGTTVPVACITSDQLLRGGNEVLIEHHGALYRLRQTSLGKLILTK
jgi:hemin uptake protein HemP